jgi:periplasmic mercuric ion binding protein
MKTHKLFLSLFILSGCFFSAYAQKGTQALGTQKTESIKVWGNCGMCKNTIHKAAKESGATYASWNAETKVLTVKYNPAKTSGKKIQQSIALTGYDTEDFTAPGKVYNSLHGCCKYERKDAGKTKDANCCDNENCDAGCCKNGSNSSQSKTSGLN